VAGGVEWPRSVRGASVQASGISIGIKTPFVIAMTCSVPILAWVAGGWCIRVHYAPGGGRIAPTIAETRRYAKLTFSEWPNVGLIVPGAVRNTNQRGPTPVTARAVAGSRRTGFANLHDAGLTFSLLSASI